MALSVMSSTTRSSRPTTATSPSHNVVVTDPKVSGLICGDGTNLAPGGSIICNATHTVTQADITAGHYLNTACVTATGLEATCASADCRLRHVDDRQVEQRSDRGARAARRHDGDRCRRPRKARRSPSRSTTSSAATTVTNGVITDVLPDRADVRRRLRHQQRRVHLRAAVQHDDPDPDLDGRDRDGQWHRDLQGEGRQGRRRARRSRSPTSRPSTRIRPRRARDTSDVFVPVPPLAETHVPTAPPTDTLEPDETSQSGSSLPLILAVLGSDPPGRRLRHPGPGHGSSPEPPLGPSPSRPPDPSGVARPAAFVPAFPDLCVATPSGVRPGRSTSLGGVPRSYSCVARTASLRRRSWSRSRGRPARRARRSGHGRSRSWRRGRSPSGGG